MTQLVIVVHVMEVAVTVVLGGITTNEEYTSAVPSNQSRSFRNNLYTQFPFLVEVHSNIGEKRPVSLSSWYQNPDELTPRLSAHRDGSLTVV